MLVFGFGIEGGRLTDSRVVVGFGTGKGSVLSHRWFCWFGFRGVMSGRIVVAHRGVLRTECLLPFLFLLLLSMLRLLFLWRLWLLRQSCPDCRQVFRWLTVPCR